MSLEGIHPSPSYPSYLRGINQPLGITWGQMARDDDMGRMWMGRDDMRWYGFARTSQGKPSENHVRRATHLSEKFPTCQELLPN